MTEYLYYINIFFTLVIFAFFSFLMFLRKEKLQRSNIILIILLLLTTITYICCFLGIKKEDAVFNFTSIQILLSGIFFNLLNILYITEIIGKTNITLKNTFNYHLPSLIYFILYLVSISL